MKNINIEKVLQVEKEAQKKASTVREFILLTLIHAEERFCIDAKTIINRIKGTFECRAIVVATEKHQERGAHYHVGIWAKNASKNNLRNKLRRVFAEWTGRAIDISLHKGWGSICLYIIKEDKEPLIWGEFTMDHIKEFAHAHETKKGANIEIGNLAILRKLEQIEDWYLVYRDEILANKLLQSLPRMKEAFEDLKTLKDIENNVFNRIINYLKEKNNPREYDVEDIREKYLVIDWIACQLCFKRPIKTKQLFIYGEPSTQKTLLMHCLAKVIKIYFASSRRNDFAGASDHYDLWVFDEFHEQEQQGEQEGKGWGGATMEGSAFGNNLLKVLDGQECRLDSKYSRVFKKKKNVPIIMIANKLPQIMERHGPFRARFFRIRFSTQIKNLEEERIIATLWGCLLRRAKRSPYAKEKETPTEIALNYNESNALILPVEKQENKNGKQTLENNTHEWINAIQKVENPIKEKTQGKEIDKIIMNKTILITKEGAFYMLKPKILQVRKKYKIIIFEILKIEEEQWGENQNQINLLNFANIPIKKKEKEEENKRRKKNLKELFEQLKEKAEQQEEKEETTEEGEHETITRLKSIFMDNKEREWIRKEKRSQNNIIKKNWVKEEEVWSVISLQRTKGEQENDYATWPLEIKIYIKEDPEEDENSERIVFPAVIRNLRRGEGEERDIINMYKNLDNTIKNGNSQRMIAIKCDISLARNGEKQPWNIAC